MRDISARLRCPRCRALRLVTRVFVPAPYSKNGHPEDRLRPGGRNRSTIKLDCGHRGEVAASAVVAAYVRTYPWYREAMT